ncbi:hypothetical protein EXS45_00405 [Candidatus Nomurabacteria bacterium]|nr:hypothetical protein [Candidatus Nomurabacteria bacterium]
MKSFQQKRGFRNILHSRPVLMFLGILVFIFAWGVIGFMGKMQVTAENRKIAENKVVELKNQKENLSSEIAKLNTLEGKEASIRERFSVAKEGEGLIVVIDDKGESKVINKSSENFFSFLFFWKNWFK